MLGMGNRMTVKPGHCWGPVCLPPSWGSRGSGPHLAPCTTVCCQACGRIEGGRGPGQAGCTLDLVGRGGCKEPAMTGLCRVLSNCAVSQPCIPRAALCPRRPALPCLHLACHRSYPLPSSLSPPLFLTRTSVCGQYCLLCPLPVSLAGCLAHGGSLVPCRVSEPVCLSGS